MKLLVLWLPFIQISSSYELISERLKFACDSRVLIDPQPWDYIKSIPYKQDEERKQYHIDHESHKEPVVDPHQQERRDVEEQELEHEVLETGERLLFQLIDRKIHCLDTLTSQGSTLTEHKWLEMWTKNKFYKASYSNAKDSKAHCKSCGREIAYCQERICRNL